MLASSSYDLVLCGFLILKILRFLSNKNMLTSTFADFNVRHVNRAHISKTCFSISSRFHLILILMMIIIIRIAIKFMFLSAACYDGDVEGAFALRGLHTENPQNHYQNEG